MVEFLNLPALYALGALPLLLVPYFLRRRPRRYVFSSLLLLQAFAIKPQRRFWGRLKLPLLFFLQLIVLGLLVAASGDPVLRLSAGEHLAIVLDNSASMQAIEDGTSRFIRAKQAAARTLHDVPAGSRVDVYLTVPWTGIVGKDLTPGDASALVANARVYDLADSVQDYGELLERLAREEGYRRVFFFTDRPARGSSRTIQTFSFGQPRDNVAITRFDVDRGGLGSAGRSARMEVSNFSSSEQPIDAVLLGEGKVLGSRRKRVPAGESIVLEFGGFPAAAYYEAKVNTEGSEPDPLGVDNRRFAIAPAGATSTILGVSPRSKVLESLRVVPGLDIDVVEPEDYRAVTDKKYGVEIFHLSAPRELPQNNALFILPPEENPAVSVGAPMADASISGWNELHPLTRYVNVSLLRPRYARSLEPKVAAQSILEGPSGSLALVFERDGFRYAVLGFDPMPFLGRQNLPMSIFTLNVLGWLQDGMTAVNQSTDDPLKLAREVRRETLTPARNDTAFDSPPPHEPPALFQGVYERFRNGKRELVAVNFDAPAESNLLNPPPVILEKTGAEPDLVKGHQLLWPYVIMTCVLLLTLEWFINPPKPEGL